MKVLGIDYGEKRVGVAVSDAAGGIAFPRATLQNDDNLFKKLLRLAEEEKVEKIVVGDTRSYSDVPNRITAEAEAFVGRLADASKLPVEMVREAGSSAAAAQWAPEEKKHDDSAAAAVILQRYLDTAK